MTVGNDQGLFPFIEKTHQELNSVSPAELLLIDMIADAGAYETVMPKGLCPDIAKPPAVKQFRTLVRGSAKSSVKVRDQR